MIIRDVLCIVHSMNGLPRVHRMLVLLAMSVLAMALDLFGVSLVFALVSSVGDPLLLDKVPGIEPTKNLLGIVTHNELLITLAILLVVVFLFRAIYIVFFSYVQVRTVVRRQSYMAQRLFAIYMAAPFAFNLKVDSSSQIRNLTYLVRNCYGLALTNLLNLTADSLVVSALVVFLMWAQPELTLIAGCVLLILVGGQVLMFRGIQSRMGAAFSDVTQRQYKVLQQSITVLKELKVLGREPQAQHEFKQTQDTYDKISWRQQLIGRLPSVINEAAIVLCVLGMLVFLLLSGAKTEEVTATLALFAAAAFRLMPLANRVQNAIGVLHSIKPGLEILRSELDVKWSAPTTKNEDKLLSFSHNIVVEGVSFGYQDGGHVALDDVSLCIRRGESVGFIGGSGAGKTTLADIILGVLLPDKGRLLVDGIDVSQNIRSWQNNVGYVPQAASIIDDTVRANVAFFIPAKEVDDEKVWKALTLAQLDEFVRGLPEGLDTVLLENGDRLSGGQKQRIVLARALYHDPDVLVLDEPTSALDPQTEDDVRRAIETLAGSKTLIIIAHRINTLKHCDHLVMMENGHIKIAGTFTELSKNSEEFRNFVKLATAV